MNTKYILDKKKSYLKNSIREYKDIKLKEEEETYIIFLVRELTNPLR